jgi:hypothetical protein
MAVSFPPQTAQAPSWKLVGIMCVYVALATKNRKEFFTARRSFTGFAATWEDGWLRTI